MIKLNEEAKSFVNEKLKEISKKHSIPLDIIKNFFSAFVLYDEMTCQVREHLEKSNSDVDAILKKMSEVNRDIMSIAMAAKINPKFVDVIKAIIKGDFDIEQLNGDK